MHRRLLLQAGGDTGQASILQLSLAGPLRVLWGHRLLEDAGWLFCDLEKPQNNHVIWLTWILDELMTLWRSEAAPLGTDTTELRGFLQDLSDVRVSWDCLGSDPCI